MPSLPDEALAKDVGMHDLHFIVKPLIRIAEPSEAILSFRQNLLIIGGFEFYGYKAGKNIFFQGLESCVQPN